MEYIRNENGAVIGKSKNLAGIRRYVSRNLIKCLAIDSIGNGNGKLCILFDNGSSFECNFTSFEVLKNFVRNWRNVYGAKLVVNGFESQGISYQNIALR
jgi:hypothetical protein